MEGGGRDDEGQSGRTADGRTRPIDATTRVGRTSPGRELKCVVDYGLHAIRFSSDHAMASLMPSSATANE